MQLFVVFVFYFVKLLWNIL